MSALTGQETGEASFDLIGAVDRAQKYLKQTGGNIAAASMRAFLAVRAQRPDLARDVTPQNVTDMLRARECRQ